MNVEIIFAFLTNILILLGLSVVYSIFKPDSKIKPIWRKVLMGFVVLLIGSTIMLNPYDFSEGIFYDSRSVLISLSGMFIGFIPTLIGMIGLISLRIVIGGAGVYAGSITLLTSGFLGLIWRKYRLKNKTVKYSDITILELYLVGLVVSVVVIIDQLFLPRDVFIDVLPTILIPYIVIYPIGSLIIALFMYNSRTRYFNNLEMVESERQYRYLFTKPKAVQFIVDPETGLLIDINDTAELIYGYKREEMIGMHVSKINTMQQADIHSNMMQAKHQNISLYEQQHITKNGEILDVEVYAGPILLEGKTFILASIIDISEKRQSERQFKDVDERLKATLLSAGEGITVCDEFGRIVMMNDRAKELIGVSNIPLNERIYNVFRIYSNMTEMTFKKIYFDVTNHNEMFRSDSSYTLLKNDNDEEIYVDFTLSPVNFESNVNHGAILVIRDVTIEKKRQEELRFVSQHDYLTKLYNRLHFEAQLERLDTKRQYPLTVLIGDINGLKLVNDVFSHIEGDQLIIEITKILKKATRADDIVARWGGDEFAILLPQTELDNARVIYERIKDLCNKSMYKTIKPSISMGCATKVKEDESIDDVIKLAEERMYHEKLIEGKQMRSMLISAVEKTLREKCHEPASHTKIMIELSQSFGYHIGLEKREIEDLMLLAKLHDIGKVSINPDTLSKTEPLTEEEWERIRIHPEVGYRIVSNIPEFQHIKEYILHHHEHWDGSGYPSHLRGDNIPYLSRLIAILDAYEVMISGRVYREKISKEKAIRELTEMSGKHFDPTIVKEFIEFIIK